MQDPDPQTEDPGANPSLKDQFPIKMKAGLEHFLKNKNLLTFKKLFFLPGNPVDSQTFRTR